ncbi:TetR/AcrR family transcriptional regulator [Marinomonas transparens]|uniref:TetR/AcrR family transcriptional regulator n=1 Tax=Marinomonas transparens TaxID=2795388 RepID=A0A934JRU4_9GAMM|nr:TetR/AcrR family transcriptional regulator [Marinomonas transparens]MBJ7536255.1 TetR/AcrR family transcriptional regulator [Marinomonas transparens]
MSKQSTYQQIVNAADNLFYQNGFEHTSFTDISNLVSISRGNFYHHFKTKNDILSAVIKARLANTQAMLDEWQTAEATPEGRIKCYIHILLTNWDKIQHYGCPVGTLCTELAKLNHASKEEATQVFTLFRQWLKQQFKQLGHVDDADQLAMHVLAWSQGVATISSTFQNKEFAEQEVQKINAWLDKLNH